LLELLKNSTFCYDTLIEFSRQTRRLLTAESHKMAAESAIALFVAYRRAQDAASEIDSIEGDSRKHDEIKLAFLQPVLTVLAGVSKGKVDPEDVRKLISLRIGLDTEGQRH